jgi:hypothetical protein
MNKLRRSIDSLSDQLAVHDMDIASDQVEHHHED